MTWSQIVPQYKEIGLRKRGSAIVKDDKIYIFGGLSKNEANQSNLIHYNIGKFFIIGFKVYKGTNVLEDIKPEGEHPPLMLDCRMVCYKDTLYVCPGKTTKDEITSEMYSLKLESSIIFTLL